MDDYADAKMILTAPPPENWKRPPGRPCIMWLNTVQRDLRPRTKWSSRPGSEQSSVEATHSQWCMPERKKCSERMGVPRNGQYYQYVQNCLQFICKGELSANPNSLSRAVGAMVGHADVTCTWN